MFCANCGKENPDSNKFCLQCGRSLATATAAPPPVGAVAPPPTARRPGLLAGRLPLILGGALLLVVLAVAAWFLVSRLSGGGGNEMLLAIPSRNDTYDLSVLRLGDDPQEATVIAEKVKLDYSAEFVTVKDGISTNRTTGSFLPGTDRLLTIHRNGDDIQVVEYRIGDDAPVELLSSNTMELAILFNEDTRDLFILELPNDGPMRCYVAEPGQPARRVARDDICITTNDIAHVVVQDTNNAGEVTVTIVDPNGDEAVLLDDVEADGFSVWTGVSADGSRALYQSRDGLRTALTLVDNDGNTIFTNDEHEQINIASFIGRSNDIYYTVVQEGVYGLFTAGGGPWVEAPALKTLVSDDGQSIAAISADRDGEGQVSVINAVDGAVTDVLAGRALQMAYTYDWTRLLISEEADTDLTLTAADATGANRVTLFDRRGYVLQGVYHIPGSDRLLLIVRDNDGSSLYVAPLDGAPGFFALEEWQDIQLHDLSGDTLLFSGQEDSGDDATLYALSLSPDADFVELDDSSEWINFAVIAPDGRTAVYTAGEGDEPTVRQVRLDGEERPEDLYENAFLLAGRWATINLFHDRRISWTNAGTTLVAPVEATPEVVMEELDDGIFYVGIISPNQTYSLEGDAGSGNGVAYSYRGRAGQPVQFEVLGEGSLSNSTLDPIVRLFDEDFNLLATDDDGGPGATDALLTYTPTRNGIYYVLITSYDNRADSSFVYRVMATEE